MACHWEDSDTVAQEIFTNVRLVLAPVDFHREFTVPRAGHPNMYMHSVRHTDRMIIAIRRPVVVSFIRTSSYFGMHAFCIYGISIIGTGLWHMGQLLFKSSKCVDLCWSKVEYSVCTCVHSLLVDYLSYSLYFRMEWTYFLFLKYIRPGKFIVTTPINMISFKRLSCALGRVSVFGMRELIKYPTSTSILNLTP